MLILNKLCDSESFIIICEYSKLCIKSILFIIERNNYYTRKKKKIKIYIIIIILIFIFLLYKIQSIERYKISYLETMKEFNNFENYLKLCEDGILINKMKYNKIENPKISVISPIYNSEIYLLRFLRSIQNQFFDDIEIILIDDFSSDNSVKIIEKFQKDDKRIKLIKHKKNKGTLISRNNGILFSKGEYLIIPDPDDILSDNILFNCYKTAKMNNFDMIRFNIYKGKNTSFFENIVNKLISRPILQPELSTYLFYGIGKLKQIDYNLSNKFIKRELYIKALNKMNDFYLKQYMTILEDGLINFILYRTSEAFYFIKLYGYYYLQNNQSITVKPNDNYDDFVRFIFFNLKFVFENTKNNRYEKNMANSIFYRFYYHLKDDFKLITKDFIFYCDIINIYLNSKFINGKNKAILKILKIILNKKKKDCCI